MNRRNFLAGLLATTAAVPLAKVLPAGAGPFEYSEVGAMVEIDGFAIFESTPMMARADMIAATLRPAFAAKVEAMLFEAAARGTFKQ